ncbi:MAG: sel1 repeat family protein [Gilliamella sp.]|uniref:tetratricopeptide repeat protein n=1 Tax=Gilliamella sp. TaxID=1891236 RepID=UPI0025DCDEC4|nr:tetratricopeptide repeat protein [Gilliamella sp.]MCO6549667.1 sel1 repeat family protein [Gilliamella sp.]
MHKKASEENNPEEQFYLGIKYLYGISLPKDAQKAIEWYETASAQGIVYAMTNIASLYYKGEVVDQDYSLAKYWLENAAEQNDHTEAQWNIGWMYSKGYCVKKDIQKAEEWYKKACKNGVQHQICN